jgi:hypothetical protein
MEDDMKSIFQFYVHHKKHPNYPNSLSEKIRFFVLRLFLPIIGLLALIWFLIRVIPKPIRAGYPCQRIAFPLASGFVLWLMGILGSLVFIRKARRHLAASRCRIAAFCIAAAALCLWLTLSMTAGRPARADNPVPNAPVGVAKGIFPGRVVWIYDPNAANWPGADGNTNPPYWHSDTCTNQLVVNAMLSRGLRTMTGQNSDSMAWEALFRYFNQQAGKGDVGYTPGEKIAIKVNFVLMANVYSGTKPADRYDQIDNSPQLTIALLRQLINIAGVSPGNISIGDPSQCMPDYWYNMVQPQCPGVVYLTKSGVSLSGRTQITYDTTAPFYWSDPVTSRLTGKAQDYIPTHFAQADYFINFAVLKSHSESGITVCGKNHYGSLRIPTQSGYYNMHASRPLETPGMGYYRANVDLMGHPKLGGKTMLALMDGLYAGRKWESRTIRWNLAPFNGDWPSSIFLSQDPVAADSVAFDFMVNEWTGQPTDLNGYPKMSGTEDYLHEAAMIPAPPSGTTYNPNHDGGLTQSLGVHEHWNNATDKQYSRNLDPVNGTGIELVYYKMLHHPPDLNDDQFVNLYDFMYLSDRWLWSGTAGSILEDLVPDGTVDLNDLQILTGDWLVPKE